MEPPEEFPFPFQPYDIQKDFMRELYLTLERGHVGIFESPTGTVRNLAAGPYSRATLVCRASP